MYQKLNMTKCDVLQATEHQSINQSINQSIFFCNKQGRIHGTSVADGWAGAVMQKPPAIQKCDLPTDRRTDTGPRQDVKSRIRD